MDVLFFRPDNEKDAIVFLVLLVGMVALFIFVRRI